MLHIEAYPHSAQVTAERKNHDPPQTQTANRETIQANILRY